MPDFSFENEHTNLLVCGCDEVGRAPLAGPVVAACVYIPKDLHDTPLWQEVNDSKKIAKKKRETLALAIKENAHWGIGEASEEETDAINIVQASFLAMTRAYETMNMPCDMALIDGNLLPKSFPCSAQSLIKGDTKSVSIAAASIIAKVHRDQMMTRLAAIHPHYGWERNAGYPTKEHLAGINARGITEHHRKSFAPVKNFLQFGGTKRPVEKQNL